MTRRTLLSLALTLLSAHVAVADSAAVRVAEVRRVWEGCEATMKSAAHEETWVDEGELEGKRRWRRTAKADRDARAEAVFYLGPDRRIIAARTSEVSTSGDHSVHVTYCFRADGSLAFLLRDFRTFAGGVKQEKRFWVDGAGVIKTDLKVFDLETGKAIGKRSYFDPDAMGWDTIPKDLPHFTARAFRSRFPR